MNLYLKVLHIIFVVTWFSGMFYIPRLFIYNAEANEKPENERVILQSQFKIMMRRLWYGITWPSAVLTLIFGTLVWYNFYDLYLFEWLTVKLIFVVGLYLYHFSLHIIFKQQVNNVFKYTSQQLRIWNEVATVFLVAIISLVVMKNTVGFVWLIIGLILLIFVLLAAIKIYKTLIRKK